MYSGVGFQKIYHAKGKIFISLVIKEWVKTKIVSIL
jgi:hypothetical protein